MQCELNVIVGFGPNATDDYYNQLFPRKIEKRTNRKAEIKCNTVNGRSQLLEIRICFTWKGDFVDCNFTYEGKKVVYIARNCENGIIFPAQRERRDEL